MRELCLGGEAFGKGLAAKSEQHQAAIEVEQDAATQTHGDFRTAGTHRAQLHGGWAQGPVTQPTPTRPCLVLGRLFLA